MAAFRGSRAPPANPFGSVGAHKQRLAHPPAPTCCQSTLAGACCRPPKPPLSAHASLAGVAAGRPALLGPSRSLWFAGFSVGNEGGLLPPPAPLALNLFAGCRSPGGQSVPKVAKCHFSPLSVLAPLASACVQGARNH